MECSAPEKRTHFLWILQSASAIMKKDSVTVCTDYFCLKKAADNRRKSVTVKVLNRYEKAM